MTNDVIIAMLKNDLQIAVNSYDSFLAYVVDLARAAITNEGIVLEDTIEDGMLVEQYAAFLYRKRREPNATIPRFLRYALNNRLITQKGSE